MITLFCGFVAGCIAAWLIKPSLPATLKHEAEYEDARLKHEAQRLEAERKKMEDDENRRCIRDIRLSFSTPFEMARAANAIQAYFFSNVDKYYVTQFDKKQYSMWYTIVISYRIIDDASPVDFSKFIR